MNNIDSVMDMLDWNNSEEVQAKGRELAKSIRCINVFLQPAHQGHSKNVWDNCALILKERADGELKPYVDRMLEWLEDMNWPGAFCIWDRLLIYKDREWLDYMLEICIHKAKTSNNSCWLHNLLEFQNHLNSI